MANCCFWFKLVSVSLFCILNIYLFVISCGISYQHAIAKQHISFSEYMPTMDTWINSPFGKLKSYLFNVTNGEAFLSGRDSKIKLEQIGPIVYKIVGHNEILNRTESSVTYSKQRYRHVEFVPEESVSPDILNKTIVQFNSVLLGAAAKYSQTPFAWMGFNPLTIGEQVFLPGSVYYFLWEFTRPGLQFFGKMVPLDTNCGTLFNALKDKKEVYTVNIGKEHGLENFFRIQTLNEEQLVKERITRGQVQPDESCPMRVTGSFDNSLFPPFLHKDTPLSIMASESCRVLPLNYQREQEHDGFTGYRYALLRPNETAPKCMDQTYGVHLPAGMFDVSRCVINDAPSAFSAPHFYGTGYDWTEHFEGLNPNAEEHEPYLIIEPTSGIPINERYRFQSSTPMPYLQNYSPKLFKLSNIIVPGFWYEFEVDHLPDFILFLLRVNVHVVPVLQPILMGLQLLCALGCLFWLKRLCSSRRAPSVSLETVFNEKPQHDPMLAIEQPVKVVD